MRVTCSGMPGLVMPLIYVSAKALNASMCRRWAFLMAKPARKPNSELKAPLKRNTSWETRSVRVGLRARRVPVTETSHRGRVEAQTNLIGQHLRQHRGHKDQVPLLGDQPVARARCPELTADRLDSRDIVHPLWGVAGIAEKLGHLGLRPADLHSNGALHGSGLEEGLAGGKVAPLMSNHSASVTSKTAIGIHA